MRLTNFREFIALSAALFGIFLLVWTLWGFVQRQGIATRSNQDSAALVGGEDQDKAAPYSIEGIVAAHLFGTAETKQPSVAEAPKTKLKLNLLGVLATDNSDLARALIQVQSKKMRSYAVGEVIEGTDAALHRVENRRVILDRQGKFESLVMARKGVRTAEEPNPAAAQNKVESVDLSPPNATKLPF